MNQLRARLNVPWSKLSIYVTLYSVVGIAMQNFGIWIQVSRFSSIYQVFTCYVLLLVPISLLLRDKSWHEQYLYGFFAMACIELSGFTLGTSIAFDGNFVEEFFGLRNFTLAMSFFYAFLIPLGNWSVDKIYARLCSDSVVNQPV